MNSDTDSQSILGFLDLTTTCAFFASSCSTTRTLNSSIWTIARGVGHPVSLFAYLLLQEPLRDELLDQREADLGTLEHRRVERAALRRAHPVPLLAQQLVEFRAADLGATDARHDRLRHVAAEMVIDTDEGEGHDQGRENDLRDATVLVDEIEQHGILDLPVQASMRPKRGRNTKEGEPKFALSRNRGGVDGTRTRDPRRDRPVF